MLRCIGTLTQSATAASARLLRSNLLRKGSGGAFETRRLHRRRSAEVCSLALLSLGCRTFSLKEKMIADRKRRDRERLGLPEEEDPENPDNTMDDVEKARADTEERARREELEAKAREALERRNAEDAKKRAAFKQFRAAQLDRSEQQPHREKGRKAPPADRAVEVEISMEEEKRLREKSSASGSGIKPSSSGPEPGKEGQMAAAKTDDS